MAYAAVVSLKFTISRFLKSYYIYIVQNSSQRMVKFLELEADSLAKVLQGWDSNSRRFSSRRLNAVDAQIRDAVFKLEDVLQSHFLHQFFLQSENIHQHPFLFCLDIEELEQDIDSLIQTVKKLKAEYIYELSSNNLPKEEEDEEEEEDDDDDNVIVKSEARMFGTLSNRLFMEIKDLMLNRRTGYRPFCHLWGMAGIGKTTLARKLFPDPSISSFYECRVFVTVGPNYPLKDVYVDILKQVDPNTSIHDEDIIMLLQGDDEEEKLSGLKWRLIEYLMDRRTLIVLDDVWDLEIVGCLFYQPGRRNSRAGSTICNTLITTRLGIGSEAKPMLAKPMLHWRIPFLDKKGSWDLLCAKVFGDQQDESSLCPPELKKAGKKIAENCEGLPLTIITVANILSKHERTPEHWNQVAANKQHSVYVEAYAKMHKVLLPSYYCLPQYLRISFLYMGVFPQNYEIPRAKLHMLWTAEGFVRFSDLSINLNIIQPEDYLKDSLT